MSAAVRATCRRSWYQGPVGGPMKRGQDVPYQKQSNCGRTYMVIERINVSRIVSCRIKIRWWNNIGHGEITRVVYVAKCCPGCCVRDQSSTTVGKEMSTNLNLKSVHDLARCSLVFLYRWRKSPCGYKRAKALLSAISNSYIDRNIRTPVNPYL